MVFFCNHEITFPERSGSQELLVRYRQYIALHCVVMVFIWFVQVLKSLKFELKTPAETLNTEPLSEETLVKRS